MRRVRRLSDAGDVTLRAVPWMDCISWHGRAVTICLNSSGADWTERIKRLAALAPGLDIFGSRFVLVDDAGWQTTDAGRAFLLSL